MGLTSEGIGLLFTIKGKNEASPAVKEFRDDVDKNLKGIDEAGKNVFNDLAKSVGLSSDQTAKLSAALPIAGAALAGVAAAAGVLIAAVAGVSVGLFNLAKSASDYAGEIFDAQLKSGLTAETLSALRFQADLSGASFEAVGKGVNKFSLLMGEAAKGSENAKEKLKALGVTSNDLETAFGQAVKTIGSLDDEIQQNTAASDAFGKKLGNELLPIIKDINGDLGGLIETAKKAGVTLTQEDIVAADAFGDALGKLSTTAKITASKFALQFAPVITQAMDDVSDAILKNQDNFVRYGGIVADVLRGIRAAAESETVKTIASIAAATFKLTAFYQIEAAILNRLRDAGAEIRENSAGDEKPTGAAGKAKSAKSSSYTDNFSGGGSGAKSGKSVEDLQKKQADLELKSLELQGRISEQAYAEYNKQLDARLKAQAVSLDDYRKAFFNNITDFQGQIQAIFAQKEAFFNRTLSGTALSNALKQLEIDKQSVSGKLDADSEKATLDTRERKIKAKEIENKQLLELEKAKADNQIAANEKLLAANEISEQEFENRKRGRTVELIEFEKKQIDTFISYLAELLTEEAKIRNLPAEEFLKANDDYQKLRNQSIVLAGEVEKAKSGAVIDETKRRIEITTNIQERSDRATEQGNENFVKGERRRYEENLKFNRSRLNNLIEYRDFELNQIKLEKQSDEQKLIDEEEAAKKSVEGFKNKKELEFQIEELYKQKRLISVEEFESRKKAIEDEFNPQIRSEATGGLFGAIAGGLGGLVGGGVDPKNEITNQADYIKAVYGDLRSVAKGAIGDMVGGLAQLAQQWILTGKFSAKGAAQMAAGIIAGIAVQSGVKALFELAEGYAAAASFPFNPLGLQQAAMHFAAATTYGLVAGAAGVAAIGLRLAIGGRGAAQESSGGFGSAGNGGAGNGQANSRSFTGGAYSGAGDKVFDYNSAANLPVQRHEIKVGSERFVFDVIENNVSKNGRMRDLFRKIAEE